MEMVWAGRWTNSRQCAKAKPLSINTGRQPSRGSADCLWWQPRQTDKNSRRHRGDLGNGVPCQGSGLGGNTTLFQRRSRKVCLTGPGEWRGRSLSCPGRAQGTRNVGVSLGTGVTCAVRLTFPTQRPWWSPWSQTPRTRAAGKEKGTDIKPRAADVAGRTLWQRRPGCRTHLTVRRHLAERSVRPRARAAGKKGPRRRVLSACGRDFGAEWVWPRCRSWCIFSRQEALRVTSTLPLGCLIIF